MNRRELLFAAAAAFGGAAAGTPTLRVMAGESPSATPSRRLFDARQSALVSALAEMIIPQTDTPGAIAAGTPAFIEMMVADWYTATERTIFLAGLEALENASRAACGREFLAADVERQVVLLASAEQQATAYVSPFPGGIAAAMSKLVDEQTPFFTKLKELTVLGYFGSEVGAKQELSYNPMPMRYEGDIDYATVGRQWSW